MKRGNSKGQVIRTSSSTGEISKQMVNKELENLMYSPSGPTSPAKKESIEPKKDRKPKESPSSEKKKLSLHYPKFKKQGFTHTDLRANEEFAQQNPVQVEQLQQEKTDDEDSMDDEVIEDVEETTRDYFVDESLPEALIVSKKEVEEAFRFLDVRQKKKLTPKDLKTRLKSFYPNMTNKEYKFLISEPDFTIQTLQAILNIDTRNSIYGSNFYRSYDPVKEAFKVFDPKDTGFIDEKHLKEIMEQLGLGPITFEDLKVLIEIADKDGDGKISLEDFREMTNLPEN